MVLKRANLVSFFNICEYLNKRCGSKDSISGLKTKQIYTYIYTYIHILQEDIYIYIYIYIYIHIHYDLKGGKIDSLLGNQVVAYVCLGGIVFPKFFDTILCFLRYFTLEKLQSYFNLKAPEPPGVYSQQINCRTF